MLVCVLTCCVHIAGADRCVAGRFPNHWGVVVVSVVYVMLEDSCQYMCLFVLVVFFS